MGQTTLIVAGGLSAAIVVAGGLFGYSSFSNDSDTETPDYLLSHKLSLEKSCILNFNRAIETREKATEVLGKMILAEKGQVTCKCWATVALEGAAENEAQLIATILPLRLETRVGERIRLLEHREEIKSAKSRNEKKLIRTKRKRVEKRIQKNLKKQAIKAIAKSGLNRKKAGKLLENAFERAKKCSRKRS